MNICNDDDVGDDDGGDDVGDDDGGDVKCHEMSNVMKWRGGGF